MSKITSIFPKFALVVMLLTGLTFGLAQNSFAAPQTGGIFNVNSAQDVESKDDVLTLPEAIDLANAGSGFSGLVHNLSNKEKAQIGGSCVFTGSPDNGGDWVILSGCGAGTLDTINFNIPGGGVHTTTLLSPLPTIKDPLIIDGYTQPGSKQNTLAVGDNAKILIELKGIANHIGMSGLVITAGGSTVRGLSINRFEGNGIAISTNGSNLIQGNFIGVGNANGLDGVSMTSGGNQIGGLKPGQRNVISHNDYGVVVTNGSLNQIVNNYIGTNPAGTKPLGNAASGVRVENAFGTLIGKNLVSDNSFGVTVVGSSTSTWIAGNHIGTDATGTKALGNGADGVYISSSSTLVGGSSKSLRNVIANNGGVGIAIVHTGGPIPVGNELLGNSIYSNGALGIDLQRDGVTKNDLTLPPDSDTGANDLQNFPVIIKASSTNGAVKGSLTSTPNTTFTIEFFASPSCDGSKHGEGQTYLGKRQVTTDANGVVIFNIILHAGFSTGSSITATATNPTFSTSEFSKCKIAQ